MSERERQATPSVEELDQLSTDELRERAFHLAEQKKDIGFFWDLLTHLQPSEDLAVEDGSAGHIGGSVSELIELFRQLGGHDLGTHEPLYRARFIEYLRTGD